MNPISPDEYRQMIANLEGLPSLPSVAAEILSLRREDKLSVSQMLPTIEKDPPLALKILKMANSAFYGQHYKVDNLKQAIVTIGLNDLTYLVLSFSIIKSFVIEGDQTYWINWTDFWHHSVSAAHISRSLAKSWNLKLSSDPYAMGLLHDIGKLVLFRLDPKRFMDTVNTIRDSEESTIDIEMDHFGITHCQAGVWLAEKWMMPKSIQATIEYHHNPVDCPDSEYRELIGLVRITDQICNTHLPNIVKSNQDSPLESLQVWGLIHPDWGEGNAMTDGAIWEQVSDEIPNINSVLSIIKGN